MRAAAREDLQRLVAAELQAVLALDVPPEAGARLDQDLHADSLDLVEVVERVERALARRGNTVVLRDDVLRTLTTVQEAADALHRALALAASARTDDQGDRTP